MFFPDVRAPACVRGSSVGARTQVDDTRVGVPARERAWRVRGRVCGSAGVGARVSAGGVCACLRHMLLRHNQGLLILLKL